MIIDPRPMELEAWINAVTFSIRDYGFVPQLLGSDWKSWARNVIQLKTLSQYQLPDPEDYTDWREWAIYFNDTVGY